MLTYENAVCFFIGFALVYLVFRAMGVFLLLLFFSLTFSLQAQTNYDLVVNDTNSPVPVVVAAPSQPDYWPAVSAGIAFGLTVCAFGWKLRLARRTTSDF